MLMNVKTTNKKMTNELKNIMKSHYTSELTLKTHRNQILNPTHVQPNFKQFTKGYPEISSNILHNDKFAYNTL